MKMEGSSVYVMLSLVAAAACIVAACGASLTTAAPTTPPTVKVPITAPTSAAATGALTAAPTKTAAATPGGSAQAIKVENGASIVFSGWGDQTEQQIYRDSIVRFNRLYPDVKVDYQPIPGDFQTQLRTALAAGAAPDVFYVDDQLMVTLGPTGQLLPLDNYMRQAGVAVSDFVPSLMVLFVQSGQTLALPKDWDTLGLIYLSEAFTAAGIAEPTANWSWDDLKNAAAKIKATGKYAGFCQGSDWARFAPFVFGSGGAFASQDFKTAAINTPEVKAAAGLIAAMEKGDSLVAPADIGASWCGEAIGRKLAGMTYERGWMVNYMKRNYAGVEWKAVPLPAGPRGKADVVFTTGIGVNAATRFPAASAALALYLAGRENQAEIQKTGFAFSTHPDQLNLIQDPNDQAIAQGGTFPLSRVAFWGPRTGAVNDAVSKALERIYLGAQTVDESLAQAQQDAQIALSQP